MKKLNLLLIAAAFIAVLVPSLYFRLYPAFFPQFKKQAREIVLRNHERQISQDVLKNFPQFYPPARQKIVNNRIREFKSRQKALIEKQADDIYKQMKAKYQDEAGQTYLMELDCWHWGRYVENVLRHGYPADQSIGGKQWDFYMTAPWGFYMLWDQFIFYLTAFLYLIFSVFKTVPLFTFLFYVPLFFVTIFLAVLFAFSFRLGKYLGAITSCLFIGMAPIFLQRSFAGWFDKDVLNLLFPLLAVWVYAQSKTAHSLKTHLLWILLAAFWVGLFCFNWTHWWFIFLIIIFYEVLCISGAALRFAIFKIDPAVSIRAHGISLAAFVFFSLAWCFVLAGPQPITDLLRQIQQAITLNRPLMTTIWPNVYSTVGELRRVSLAGMAGSMGGMTFFYGGLASVGLLFARTIYSREDGAFKRTVASLMFIWALAMLFASLRGVRFTAFLLLPLGVSLGWVLHDAWVFFRQRSNYIGLLIVLAVFFNLIFTTVSKGQSSARGLLPLMDDTWYRVLTLIKEKTPEQTVINSWWDFGDWFKVVAKRRVIFDGQSQDTPQAYWMARVILAGDEELAVAILRMLNNGGNKAFELIDDELKNPFVSVLLLESVLGKPADTAQKELAVHLSPQRVQDIMKILYYNPTRAVFVAEYTMLPKIAAISFLGNWDFSKAYIAQKFNVEEKDKITDFLKKLGKDDKQIEQYYQEAFLLSSEDRDDWLSRRVRFYSDVVKGREANEAVVFDNGFVYYPKEKTVQSNSGQTPRSFFVVENGNLVETGLPNPNVPFSIFILKDDKSYYSILLDRELANTMLVRLYLFNGMGLKHFVPFIDADDAGNHIRVFNIVW